MQFKYKSIIKVLYIITVDQPEASYTFFLVPIRHPTNLPTVFSNPVGIWYLKTFLDLPTTIDQSLVANLYFKIIATMKNVPIPPFHKAGQSCHALFIEMDNILVLPIQNG